MSRNGQVLCHRKFYLALRLLAADGNGLAGARASETPARKRKKAAGDIAPSGGQESLEAGGGDRIRTDA